MNTFIIINGIRINTSHINYYCKSSHTDFNVNLHFLIKIYFNGGEPVVFVAKTEEEQDKILHKLDEYLMVNKM